MKTFDEGIFMIGAGSMAEAFIRGVTEKGAVSPETIYVINRSHPTRVNNLQKSYGIQPATSWADISKTRLVVVAVKPSDVAAAVALARPHLDGQWLLSFAAGVTMSFLKSQVNGAAKVIRTMPNIPVAVLAGATAVSFSEEVDDTARAKLTFLLHQVGEVVDIPESMMDAATAFSGSGPGFVSYFLESMEKAAVQLGFDEEMARKLLLQTVVGTAKTLWEWGLSPEELRHRVTSPNGTTHAGLSVMESQGLMETVERALKAAADRSAEMGLQYTTEFRALSTDFD